MPTIKRDGYELKDIVRKGYPLSKVYRNGYLVWQKGGGGGEEIIASGFRNGYWVDELPWIDTDAWRDN